jgi:DNA-binding YbaB/EbfC family protein
VKLDMNALMKQAQQMQEQMVRAQEEAKNEIAEASAGGGMVTVKANGAGELLEIAIDPRAIDPDDPELLATWCSRRANEALRAATQAVETKLRGQMPDLGALGLPACSSPPGAPRRARAHVDRGRGDERSTNEGRAARVVPAASDAG